MGLEAAHGDAPGIAAVTVVVIFWTIAIVSTFLRIWSRRMKRSTFVLNDYALLLSLVFTTGTAVVTLIGVLAGGMGKHIADVNAKSLKTAEIITFVGQLVWATANFLIKVSILHLYNRIFFTKAVKIASYILMALSFCLFAAIVLAAFLVCRPLAYNWDKTIEGGRCANVNQDFLAQAIINLLLDITIVSLPLPVLWNLQMKTGKKVSIIIMFSIGYCICILTGLRIYALKHLDPNDYTRGLALFAVFNVLELCLGTLVASLPVSRPIAAKIYRTHTIQWLFSGTRSSSKTKYTSQKALRLTPDNDGRKADSEGKTKDYPPSYWSRVLTSSVGHQGSRTMDDDLYPLNDTTVSAIKSESRTPPSKETDQPGFAPGDIENRPVQSPSGDIHVTREVMVR